jgi:ribosomal protein L11 methyltransferase
VPWLALMLEVEAAQAEALSEALLEQGAQSVWIEPAGHLHALLPEGSDAATALGLAAAAAAVPAPPFRTCAVADEDWVRATQAQFAPQCVAGRLWIVPSWHAAPAEGIVLKLDPGLAFGTGSHATTRTVLTWLASAALAGARVLDYGCGSGILAIAAAKLGAAHVDAVDIDDDALAVTGDNARANQVQVRACPPERLAPGEYDIVVANILAQPLIALEPLLAARTRRGGFIALAGILETQATDVLAAYGAHCEARVAAREEGWVLVEGRRR